MSGRVLCAIDIGDLEQGRALLARAAQLAALDDADLDIITVLPGFGSSLVGSFFPDDAEAKLRTAAGTALQSAIDDALSADAAARVPGIVAVGTAYEEILNTADKIGASLIVIGSHRRDLKDFLLGPNAARVARHAGCSVYIMRLP